MLKPHTFRKLVIMSEEEWLTVFFAAKQQGVDPVQFIKSAAVAAGKNVVTP